MKRMLMIIALLMSIAGADTLYFKNGDVLKNCREIKRTETYLTVEYVQSGVLIQNHFNISSLDRIEPGEFKTGKESIEESRFYLYHGPEMPEMSDVKLNYKMLPVSLIALVLGNDNYKHIKDIDDSIDMTRQQIQGLGEEDNIFKDMYEESIRKLEDQKKEYKTKATIFFSIAIVNTIFAFEKVEIQPSDSGVQLSYKF